ncbi:hypothetical protein J4474_01655 [Candidatus Pacearchaeota archaeon]|nr:hypothetical protein [Candidatus Pacearchaeota archaeon]
MENNNKIKSYDGVTKIITNTGVEVTFLNIYEALEQENPRNVFLSGQLYIEDRLDTIISMYFGDDNNIRHSSILKFLKSRYCDFFSKIQFLSMLIEKYKIVDGKQEIVNFIENKKIISGLKTIGEVRNSFQHNLVYGEAFKNVIKGGHKFIFIDKKLDTCNDLKDLVKSFKEEVILLVGELDKVMIKEFTTHKIDIETLKKALTTPDN